MESTPWIFPLPDDMLKPKTKLFIYESCIKIGLGTVIGNGDGGMLVDIEFTDHPRLGVLQYATVAEAAGLEGA